MRRAPPAPIPAEPTNPDRLHDELETSTHSLLRRLAKRHGVLYQEQDGVLYRVYGGKHEGRTILCIDARFII